MASLHIDQLSSTVGGEEHLTDVDLHLEAGTFHVLLGPTRAGKTSLLRQVAGLDRPTGGGVRLRGDGAEGLRGQVAMVYQDFVNYPSLRVRDNIAAPLRAQRVPKVELEQRVRAAAERVGLSSLLERLPAELSGGQQQRLAIARALVQEAPVVLLDEPLANLDYKLREALREEVRELFSGARSIVLYATTDPAEALWFGGQVVVLDEGRVLQAAAGREVYDAPASERVARITSDPPINLWDAEHRDGGLHLGPGLTLPVPAHLSGLEQGPCRLGLRPHHLAVAPREDTHCVPVRVELAEVNGSTTLLHARAGELSLLAEEASVRDHRLGEELDVFLDPAHLFAFGPDGRLLVAPQHCHGQD